MKKLIFFCAVFIALTVNAQKKQTQIDCSVFLKDAVKRKAQTWYTEIYDYNVISYKKELLSDLLLISGLALFYMETTRSDKELQLKFLKEGKTTSADYMEKKADINFKKSSTLSSLTTKVKVENKTILKYEVKYRIKGDDEDEIYNSNFYFTKKCINLSEDELYDFIIDNIER